ncbi:PAN2-PAN3 deadenylation complex catalytic subunit PAN2 isoform X2 [Centruroides vittatus]|uniref:PAN2-PAN3 deadenylation complex catalytic subunit PAN2 isoform X2 n=1 Tax=Centruroides vittatus TaxID=120091 RepID=UPI00350E9D8E
MEYSTIESMELSRSQLETYSEKPSLPQYSTGSLALGQEYSHLHSILADGGNQFGVSSLTFDLQEDLLWMGNQGGHITSYYGSALQKYTSFQVHATNEIREMITVDTGILSLTCNYMRLSSRRGLAIFGHSSEHMQDMQCMVLMPSGNLLVGGHQPFMVEFDLNLMEETGTIEVGNNGCVIMRRHPRFLCCGDTSGKITLRDPNSLSVEHTLDAHSGMLSDFDVHGNLLVTCGFSSRHGNLTVDRFLMVYDLRVMRSMTPIQLMFPPLLLRFVPAFTSRICVVSQSGQFQLLDTGNNNQSPYIHHVENGCEAILTFDTSSSGQALALGDAAGYIHFYGASNEVNFNAYSRPTEFPDSVEPHPPIDINDEVTPLSTIPMPHCTGKLLSDWPEEFMKVHYRCTPAIDPQILGTVRMVGPIGYAPNPGIFLRNQVPYPLDNRGPGAHRDIARDDTNEIVPQRYLKLEVKYSRTGTEDMDYSRYNRTGFSGLEPYPPNAYCNNMIQVLYFIQPLKCALLSHICQREFCLSCELGFLFHMLDTAQGSPCQASNFLRAFRTIPEASALGLILTDLSEARRKTNIPQLVQSWTRFLLQQIHTETLEMVGNENNQNEEKSETVMDGNVQSFLSQLFGAQLISHNHCRCGEETVQESTTLLCSLVYPDCMPAGKPPIQFNFHQILKKSLLVEQNMPAWCEKCEKYQVMQQRKKLKTLPDILVISCGLDNQQDLNFWKTQMDLLNNMEGSNTLKTLPDIPFTRKPCRYGNSCNRADCKFLHDKEQNTSSTQQQPVTSWLPSSLRIKLDEENDDIIVENISDLMDQSEDSENKTNCLLDDDYELIAVVNVINDPKEYRDNIISCIKVNNDQKGIQQWYLFNDFSITPITEQEALFINLEWKLPCVLYYSCCNVNKKHSCEVRNPISEQVFREDVSLAARGGQSHIMFTPLKPDEMPKAGQIVAMDAEFVTLNQEEAEIRSDGTRSTIRPSQLSVARISCVRGDGSLQGIPFIDDYISTQEQVVDYLTKFSGIQPGDLDVTLSSKHLTTLKATYQKLRFLVDIGVKFVGHGLKTDFRVINLVVPSHQIVDTVLLFHLPNKRMVSLRFLAWHFLDLKIQSETHDSVEDAKTALQLYKKYQQLYNKGEIQERLKELYEIGRLLQWKVPGTND